jgi:hypothetical protein
MMRQAGGMNVRTRLIYLLCFAILVATTVAQQPAPAQLTAPEALRLVRAVNTAAGRLSAGNGEYPSLRDLITNPAFAASAAELQMAGADAATVKGYRLYLTRSEGNRGYLLSLTPAAGCGASWFSSERGVIYTGECLQ